MNNWKFNEIFHLFASKGNHKYLKNSNHGIERETLRIDRKAQLAQSPHPETLGRALTNKFITTDFSEAQLELVTNPYHTPHEAMQQLKAIHTFVAQGMDEDELMWPFSMPPVLPKENKIPLAQYGRSATGQKKTKYREGLSARYGSKMQTVSGTHYNFSFSDSFWNFMYKQFGETALTKGGSPHQNAQAKTNFISAAYLHMARNFQRFSWLNTYLFGAAPIVHKSYLTKKFHFMKRYGFSSFYGQYATSFRLSEVGYYSRVQAHLPISYNSLEEYVRDIKLAITTPSPKYKNIKGGLNENILQIENEHYSRIRPKQPPLKGETVLQAIKKRGIKYLEVRSVDINPYAASGLACDQICFLKTFLLYCLFKESPAITEAENKAININQGRVAVYGRKPGLTIMQRGKELDMIATAEKMLLEMEPLLDLLDRHYQDNPCSASFNMQFEKLRDSSLTPSAQILHDLKHSRKSYIDFGLDLARKHKEELLNKKIEQPLIEELQTETIDSFKKQEDLEILSDFILDGCEDLELSTQILIRGASKRGIKVELLDRGDNFIRLSKGKKVEYVKQATKTSKDTYITALIMENKEVSKTILAENGIKVPKGRIFYDIEEALDGYVEFSKIKCVIKPVSTNHGIAVAFAEPRDKAAYEAAAIEAFKHGKSIIVEEFFAGNEYRFLVIDYKLVSALNRVPANVVGDGVSTISELSEAKNADPLSYKPEIYYIRLGEVEKAFLAAQKLTFTSVPKVGQMVYLRENSNVGTGGDPIDVTEYMPQHFKDVAVKAARAANAKFCGIDMIIEGGLSAPQHPVIYPDSYQYLATATDYAIIEINFNPALQMHDFPYRGRAYPTADIVLDCLGF